MPTRPDTFRWNLNIRGPIAGDVFVGGQAFFEFLDSSFKKGNDVLVSEMANDGSIFCILCLVASQQASSSNIPLTLNRSPFVLRHTISSQQGISLPFVEGHWVKIFL